MHIISTHSSSHASAAGVSLSTAANSSIPSSGLTSSQGGSGNTVDQITTAAGAKGAQIPQDTSVKGTTVPATKAPGTSTVQTATNPNLDSQLAQITRLLPQQQILEAKLLKTGQLVQLPLPGSAALLTQQSTENNQLNLLLRRGAGLLRAMASREATSNNIQSRLQGLLPSTATNPSGSNTSQVFLNNPSEGPKLLAMGQLISVAKTESGFQIASSRNGVNQHLIRLLLPSEKPLNRSLLALAILSQQGQPKTIAKHPNAMPSGPTLASILKLIPLSEKISPEIIRQTVNHSGLLADTSRNAGLGTLLLTLIKQLQPVSELTQSTTNATQPTSTEALANASTMRQLATDALAKILFNQLRPLLETSNEGLESRRLDFLVKHEDQFSVVDLEINRHVPPPEQREAESETDTDKSKVRRWDVRLNFNLEQLGQITANIKFTEGISLDLTFWAERPHTFELLNRHAKGFRENLGESLTLIAGQQTVAGQADELTERKSGSPRISISLAVINEAHPEPKISLSSQLVDVSA